MTQFTLDLVKNVSRPIVILKDCGGLRALLDTGAIYPVWTATEDALRELGGRFEREGIPFGGFGGETKGNLYILQKLTVGRLTYIDLPIIACNDLRQTPFQLILSNTMFRNLIYEIDDKNNKFNIIIPNDESSTRLLKTREINGRLCIYCMSGIETEGKRRC